MFRVPLRRLSYTKLGDGSGTPVVMCHGLLGNKNNFNNIGKMMSFLADRPVFTMDMLNHGSAAWTENGGYEFMADEVKKAIEEVCGGKAVVLGHSMGGRVAMWTALTAPDLVENLMIVDVTANNWVRVQNQPNFSKSELFTFSAHYFFCFAQILLLRSTDFEP